MFVFHCTLFFSLSFSAVIHQGGSVGKPSSCVQDFSLNVANCFGLHLRSVPTDLLPDLIELYLGSNLLTTLKNDSFARYPHIQVLNLENNNISRLEGGTFTPLKNLKSLNMGNNPYLPTLKKSIFNSKSLTDLRAYNSSQESFVSDIVALLARGASINLFNNLLEKINWTSSNSLLGVDLEFNLFQQITKNTFVLNCSVDNLYLGGNPIYFIEALAISSLKVKLLSLRKSYLKISQYSLNLFRGISMSTSIAEFDLSSAAPYIYSGFFGPLRGKYLENMNLGRNDLHTIHDNALSDLTKVSQLDLYGNYLQTIEPRYFNGMFALRSVTLERNKIITINTKAAAWNLSLTYLNLANNNIREINSSFFSGLTTLQVLNLSANYDLNVIDSNTFANLSSFTDLDISYTEILRLFVINPLPVLKTLSIREAYVCPELIRPGNLGNKTPSLARFDLFKSDVYASYLWDPLKNLSSFSGLHNLLHLDLSGIELNLPPVEIFNNLTNLHTLLLEDCSLGRLEVDIFRDLENLVKLNLKHNYLSALSPLLFDNMNILQRVELANNELTYLDSELFKYSAGLVFLDISSNNLYGLNKSTFEPLSSLNELIISYNFLVCNCDLKWIFDWLKGSVELSDSVNTICFDSTSTLEPFRGKQLITFDPGDECSPNITLYCCLSLVGVVLVLTPGLIYYQRWWVRYRLFLLKLCFIGYHEIHDDVDRREFQYDVAIMLHEVDDEWVNQNLRPALAERVPDYDRIVCGDEELMLGMYYLDAVHYATEQSFKTIVVISREAIQDRWFIMKFRTVLDHVNDVGIEKVILIFVEDIAGDELPFLIRLFLSDHRPYLIWPDDERGQEYFWQELVKDLTVNMRCNNLVPPD